MLQQQFSSNSSPIPSSATVGEVRAYFPQCTPCQWAPCCCSLSGRPASAALMRSDGSATVGEVRAYYPQCTPCQWAPCCCSLSGRPASAALMRSDGSATVGEVRAYFPQCTPCQWAPCCCSLSGRPASAALMRSDGSATVGEVRAYYPQCTPCQWAPCCCGISLVASCSDVVSGAAAAVECLHTTPNALPAPVDQCTTYGATCCCSLRPSGSMHASTSACPQLESKCGSR